jgi:ubiquinone biosynthesis protein
MTLMVKALVTYEGVGRTLDPDLDVVSVSRRHVQAIFRERFDPRALGRELVSNAPEFIDVMMQLPQLMSQGASFVDERLNTRPSSDDQIEGLRSGIIAGSCIVGGVMAVVQGGPLWLSIPLFVIGGILALFAR